MSVGDDMTQRRGVEVAAHGGLYTRGNSLVGKVSRGLVEMADRGCCTTGTGNLGFALVE